MSRDFQGLHQIHLAIQKLKNAIVDARNAATIGAARMQLGIVLSEVGRYRWALGCYERAEVEFNTVGDREGAAFARNNRGTVLYELGNYEGALVLQIEAMTMLRDIGAPHLRIATGLRNIGAALHKLGKFEAAIVRYDEALCLLKASDTPHRLLIGGLRFNRGAARERLGDLPGAADDYEAAMSAATEAPPDQIEARTADAAYHLATVLHALGNPTRAAALARSAVVGAVRARRSDLVWRCLAAFARVARSGAARITLGKIAATLLWAEARRVAGAKLSERDQYLGVRGSGFAELSGALVEEGRLAEALAVGRLEDHLGIVGALPMRWLMPEAVALTEAESAALVRWQALVRAIRMTPDSEENTQALVAWLDAPMPLVTRPISAPAIVAIPPAPNRIRLHFASKDGKLFRVVTGPGRLTAVSEGPPLIDLNRRIFDFARLCRRDGEIEAARTLGNQLFADLFGGINLNAVADSVLEIAVEGALRALPWPALWDGTRYLVERHPVEILCGGMAPRRVAVPKWALFAASGAQDGTMALPHAAREVAAIAALDIETTVLPLVDDAFTPESLRQTLCTGVTGLHIAGHFAIDPADIGRSRLRMGDGTALEVRALAKFNLSNVAEVVLSSCEAGLGDRAAEAGDAKSLPDLLAGLGVGHIVAALWPIPDASTADLMIDYHRARRVGLPPARALADAQRKALSGRANTGSEGIARGIGDPATVITAGADLRTWAGFCAFAAVADERRPTE